MHTLNHTRQVRVFHFDWGKVTCWDQIDYYWVEKVRKTDPRDLMVHIVQVAGAGLGRKHEEVVHLAVYPQC